MELKDNFFNFRSGGDAMRGPQGFIAAVEILATEAVATSAIEGIKLDLSEAREAAKRRLHAQEVSELMSAALALAPNLTKEHAEQVALKAWEKLMVGQR